MKIHSILPFLEKEEINKLIDEVMEKKVDMKLIHILPYADEEKMDAVVHRALYDDSVLVYVNELLPFLNQRQLDTMYDAYQDGTIHRPEKMKEGDILPYLSKEKIKKIFDESLAKMKKHLKSQIKEALEEVKHHNEEDEEK